MKNKIIIAFTLLCTFTLCVNAQQQNKSIMFVKGTISETLGQAKKSNKLVFVDCYTSWCGPCKMMEKYVFTNDTVASYFNKTFVNYELDMEKGEGPEFNKKYKVSSYPTYLFLDGDGKVVHRSGGKMPALEFIAVAQKAANPSETSLAIEARYAGGDRSPELVLKYIEVLKRTIPNKATRIYQENLVTVSDEVLLTDLGWEIIKLYPLNEEDRLYKFLNIHEAHFVSKYGKDEVEKIQKQVETRNLSKALFTKDKENFFKRLAVYRQNGDAEALRKSAQMELVFYIFTHDYTSFINIAKQYSQSVLKTDDTTLSFVAHYCEGNSDDNAALQQALAMARQALMLNGKVYVNQRTYADLCYKLGLKEEAFKAAQACLQIIGDENPKVTKLVEQLIEKIKLMQ